MLRRTTEAWRRGKPVGFRTNILTCLGSSLYMPVGKLLQQAGKTTGIDPPESRRGRHRDYASGRR